MHKLTDHTSQNNGKLTSWLKNSEGQLVVAVFFTEWAGSVEILRGFMKRVNETYPNLTVDWIDVEKNQGLSVDLGVSTIPSIILFRNREVVDHIGGVIPRRKIEERMKPYL